MLKSKDAAIIDIINAREFARMLGISYPTFFKYKKRSDFPHGFTFGSHIVWRRDVAEKYIKKLGM